MFLFLKSFLAYFYHFSFCFIILVLFFGDNSDTYVGFFHFDSFKLFIYFHIACFFHSSEKCFQELPIFFFFATSAWPFSCDGFIFSSHLFPLTVHVFTSCLAISFLMSCVSALNSCFYKMIA